MRRKFNVFVVVLILGFTSWGAIKSYVNKQKLVKNGVYVIGSKFDYKSGGNRMGSSYYFYHYEGKRYEFHIGDGGQNDSLLFFIILPSDPEICRIIDRTIPSCLTLLDVPNKGWEKLPLNACN